MAGLSDIEGFSKRYFGVQIARKHAADNQPVYDKPIKKEGLREAVQRYAFAEIPTRYSPTSPGYGVMRSDGSLDSLRDALSDGRSLDAKLYRSNDVLASSTHPNYVATNSIDSLIGIDPSPRYDAKSSRMNYGSLGNSAFNGYLN